MKTIVSMGELREAEIKPSELLAEYHRFLEKDVRALWSQAGLVRLDSCPACGSEGNAAFEKWGVAYRRCSACRSLYAFERPGAEVIERHYAQSKSATYWREKILNRTEDARQQKVLAPRAEWVLDGLAEYFDGEPSAAWDASAPSSAVVEPVTAALDNVKWSDPKQGGVRADFATAFDSFDRAARPAEFLERAAGALRPGGLLFLTATSGTSLEIQLLGTQSPSVVPPDRINLYSIEGLRSALAEPSWEICEISTPGLLDVQLLQEHLGATSDPNSNAEARFFKYLLEERGPECRQSLQEFLQIHRFSSHARVLARRLK